MNSSSIFSPFATMFTNDESRGLTINIIVLLSVCNINVWFYRWIIVFKQFDFLGIWNFSLISKRLNIKYFSGVYSSCINWQREPYGQKPVSKKFLHFLVLYCGAKWIFCLSSCSPWANAHLSPNSQKPFRSQFLHNYILLKKYLGLIFHIKINYVCLLLLIWEREKSTSGRGWIFKWILRRVIWIII